MTAKSRKYPYVAIVAATVLLATAVTEAQSIYSNLVMSLNPVAYWPLQETTQPPGYDIETNYGSLGSIANVYYASVQALSTNIGAITGDGDGSKDFLGSANSFALVPTTDNRVSLPSGQPFTVECWARATGGQSYVGLVNQTGPNNAGGLNGVNNSSGWSLCQNFAPYRGTATPNNPACFSFHVFNNNGFTGGGEVEVTNALPAMWLTGGGSGYQNSWVYLCGVFDGTNCWLYMYSTNLNSAYSGTNATIYQIPITAGTGTPYFGTPANVISNATFTPDTWDPILFAATRGLGANPYHGFLDEVAIYTNALTPQQITNHFAAGVGGLGNYRSTILGDNPYMYWRMDAPKWTYPPVGSLPVAADYGSAAVSMTNLFTGGSGANCGVYQPGTVPGVPGPAYPGFGALTNACAFNGLVGAVDVGYNPLLDPTGNTNNFTLVAWFKGNPMDSNGRYNCLASHTDKSWKAQMKNGTVYGYKGAGAQPNISPATFNSNDGKWHMYVLESGYFNGSTNVSIYLDNGLYYSASLNTNFIPGNPGFDAWIGGAPDASYAQPTNEASYTSGQQYFAGEVAHVAYFTNILSPDQIRTLYFTAQPAPTITRQPVSANGGLNGAFTNTVAVDGQAPFYYQWYTNGAGISGATNATLIINPVMLSDAGTNYYVVITNIYGAVTSSVVSLTVVSNLSFTAQYPVVYGSPITLYGGQIVGGTNYLGSTPTFSIYAVGAAPVSYQWLTNGVAMGGANGSSLTISNCQMTSPTNFACIANNSFGSITSMVWSVTYIPAPMAPFPQAVLADQPIGYWRMNEGPDNGAGNQGVICNDYQSGQDGTYTNTVLANAYGGTGYSPLTDPTETAAYFGQLDPSFVGLIQPSVNFATPVGGNGEFTVAVWANGNHLAQPANGGLVTRGNWGSEQFTLDEGATPNDVRFVVRDALTGNYYTANSSFNLGGDASWHFITGVCDESNSLLSLYIDGQLVGTGTLAAGSGILDPGPVPIMLGARNTSTTLGGAQFNGLLDDAAIFNLALRSNQVLGLYNIAGIPPYFIHQPVNSMNVDQYSTVTIPTTVGGSPQLSYQWYDVNLGNAPILGQTNATLVISNIVASDSYYLVVTNGYGSTNTVNIQIFVSSGIQISQDVQNPFYALLGGTANNSATVAGSLPIGYQWQYSATGSNWANLTDNSRITGSQSPSLAIANVQSGDAAYYQFIATNSYGSVTSSVAKLVIVGLLPVTINATNGWTASGSARFNGGVLSLTDPNNGGGTGAYFFQVPQYVGGFKASFTYQAQYVDTIPLADGVTFCLQDDPRGVTASGSGGGALGYTGIAPSVALELNIFPGNGVGGMGYSFDANGLIGPNSVPGAVSLTNGPVDVSIAYGSGQIALSLSNELTADSFSTNISVGDITQVLGAKTAYIGFTGAYGGDHSVQTISNFSFVSQPVGAIQIQNGTNALISWPSSVPGYVLQQNGDLTTTNWVTVTNQANVINGANQIALPLTKTNMFYRLILQQ